MAPVEYIYKVTRSRKKLILLWWAEWQKIINTATNFILTKWNSGKSKELVGSMLKTKLLIKDVLLIKSSTI